MAGVTIWWSTRGVRSLFYGLDFIERDYLTVREGRCMLESALHARERMPAGSTATSAGLNHRSRGKGAL